MAPSTNTIHLARPDAGQTLVLDVQPEHLNLSLDFPTDSALLKRTDGNLEFVFDDGASIVLQDFYKAYTSTTIPDFEVQGKLVKGTDFFAILGEEFIPAAGEVVTTLPSGGRFYDESTMSLAGGLDALGGLDTKSHVTTQASTFFTSNTVRTLPPDTSAGDATPPSVVIPSAPLSPAAPPLNNEDGAPSSPLLPPPSPPSDGVATPVHGHDYGYVETSGGLYDEWDSQNTTLAGQESFVFTSTPQGSSQFGTFSLENGTLKFSPDAAAVNQLGPGQQIIETFTVVDANGQSHTLTLTFTGSNANDDTLTVVDFTAGTVTATNAVGGSTPFTMTPDADGSIHLGEGNDVIFITGTMSGGTLQGDAGNDTFWVNTMSGGNIIDMSAEGATGNAFTVLTLGTDATLTTGAGSDSITIGYLKGSLDTGTGADSITIGTVGDGANITCSGTGNVITIGAFDLGATLTLSGSGNVLYMGHLYDFDNLHNAPITVSTVNDTLVGTGAMITRPPTSQQNNDINDIVANGTDSFYDGQGGNDSIIGSGANETIMGGAGNNLLRGGKGDDILWGHGNGGQETTPSTAGNNIFIWDASDYDKGTDSIMDFELGKDWIYLGGNVSFSVAGSSLKILDATGTLLQTITLEGTGIANADPSLWLLTDHETHPGRKGLAQLAEELASRTSPAGSAVAVGQTVMQESGYGIPDFGPNSSADLADAVALEIMITTAA